MMNDGSFVSKRVFDQVALVTDFNPRVKVLKVASTATLQVLMFVGVPVLLYFGCSQNTRKQNTHVIRHWEVYGQGPKKTDARR